jgi:hypothetical protein
LAAVSAHRTLEEYLQQARRNSEFAANIRENHVEYLDWAATCLFYSAVHYVDAYLVKVGIPIPRRHSSGGDPKNLGRTNIVQQESSLKTIYIHYRHLDDESRDARYELKRIPEADYDNFLLPQLYEIQKFITAKIMI